MHMMHACMTQRYEMISRAQKGLTDHDLLPSYAQKLLKTKKKETHLNLNPIFSFFQFSLFGRVTLSDHPLFNKYFFRKKTFFLSFFHGIIFLSRQSCLRVRKTIITN